MIMDIPIAHFRSGYLMEYKKTRFKMDGTLAKKKHKNYISQNWAFKFELTEIQGIELFTMTDYGTCGLTGNLTSEELRTRDVSAEELPEYERWARWESLGFTKTEGLGARGQGKMIFMLASKDFAIFYDSLRDDGSYRFGGSQAMETGCPLFHYDNDEARKVIKDKLGVIPLNYCGTRIIIFHPVTELVEDIKNGNLIRYIEETWWPSILKYGARIQVHYAGKSVQAKVPERFPITKEQEETDSFKTWIKEADDFKKLGLKIKKLCFACDKNNAVDELTEGISCFRDGMKVDTVRFPIKSFRNRVYGYAEFEPELEMQLREIEKPTHYAFKGAIWSKIKNLIEQELEAFANKKLGLGIDTQASVNIKRNHAESKALSVLKAVTKNWPLTKGTQGVTGGDGGDPAPIKDIGIRLSDLTFPNPGNIPRLDYGQKLQGFKIVVYNQTNNAINVSMSAFVLSGDTKILDFRNESFVLSAKSTRTFSGDVVEANKVVFKNAGVYRIRLNLVDNKKSIRLDEITRRIWIETDPDLVGPFEVKRLKFSELPPELNVSTSKEWVLSPEGDDKYTLYYNLDHPAYLYNEDEEKLVGYLSEVFSLGALELLIRQSSIRDEGDKNIKESPIDLEMLKSSNPLESFISCVSALSKLREKIFGII